VNSADTITLLVEAIAGAALIGIAVGLVVEYAWRK
jgi:hypothetical protein